MYVRAYHDKIIKKERGESLLVKNSLTPLYAQLQKIIKQQILTKQYKEGEAIPSEVQITRMYNITRTTVRKAISNLIQEGFLYQVHGKGTFVRLKEVKHSIWNFEGFTDYLRSKNEVPYSKVISSEIIEKNEETFFYLKRYRGINKDNSIIYLTLDTSYIPISRLPEINNFDFSSESLYDIMRQKYFVYPKQFQISLFPINCNSEMMDVFDLHSSQQPLLKAEGHVLDQDNTIVEYVEVVYGPNIDFRMITNASN